MYGARQQLLPRKNSTDTPVSGDDHHTGSFIEQIDSALPSWILNSKRSKSNTRRRSSSTGPSPRSSRSNSFSITSNDQHIISDPRKQTGALLEALDKWFPSKYDREQQKQHRRDSSSSSNSNGHSDNEVTLGDAGYPGVSGPVLALLMAASQQRSTGTKIAEGPFNVSDVLRVEEGMVMMSGNQVVDYVDQLPEYFAGENAPVTGDVKKVDGEVNVNAITL
ncbi:hypothetical protein HDU76_000906 [Blyttiomyces sp. JEL0837]|nr:hypothetical protein HDU76_000906 [Blyttiomyces sp. JEL0837]